MKPHRHTITLTEKLPFSKALEELLKGTCIGIRPSCNTNYIVLFKPNGMNPASPDWCLKWEGSRDDSGIRTNQYLEDWYLVIFNHLKITEYLNQLEEEVHNRNDKQ